MTNLESRQARARLVEQVQILAVYLPAHAGSQCGGEAGLVLESAMACHLRAGQVAECQPILRQGVATCQPVASAMGADPVAVTMKYQVWLSLLFADGDRQAAPECRTGKAAAPEMPLGEAPPG